MLTNPKNQDEDSELDQTLRPSRLTEYIGQNQIKENLNIFLSAFDNRLTGLIYSTSLLVIMAFLVSILFDKIKERRTTTAVLVAETTMATTISNKPINLLK